METLLDRHLATLETWLQAYFKSLSVPSWSYYHLTVVTLLDQLDPKEFRWRQVEEILQASNLPVKFSDLFDDTGLNIEFTRIVSEFLMDRERAGSLWVNSYKYAGLTTYILEVLCDKWVYNAYTLVHANTNAWIHSRCFTDIVDINTPIRQESLNTYYKIGKLAFDLLPILLSRIQGPAVSQVQDILLGLPTFDLIQSDPLGLQKVKATQAIKEFLKVWF